MNVRRILEMGVDELASRSRQEASKLLERMRLANGPGRSGALSTKRGPISTRPVRRRAAALFADAAPQSTAALLRERFREEADRTVKAAESICEGRFDLLGHRGLFFGDPVDWHLDPASGRRAPMIHWSRLDPLDATVGGDVKVIWELNRHQWLIPLGQAYRITGEERFAEAAARYVEEWILANPHGHGINWASSLETALRLISWCWAATLMQGARSWSPLFVASLHREIAAHACHVARYLSHHFSPNTHLTGEALGLLYAGLVLDEEHAARRWRNLAAKILIQESRRQILADGVYFERTTCYQRYTIDTYLQFLILADLHGIEVPVEVSERVQRSLDFLLAVRSPRGRLPQIGDGDGGFLLPLAKREPDDLRGVFSTAAALLKRADYAWAAGEGAPETLWLLGPRGLESFDGLKHSHPASSPSRIYPEGGFAVMRSSWGPEAHQLILDTGPIGCSVSAGHGHADLLSLQCSAFGDNYLVDPGTFTYAAEPGWRDHFRSTAAHSTLILDGKGQAEPAGPFSWVARPSARLRRWYTGEEIDYADAEHEAYSRPGAPIVHRRRVLFVKPSYWVVVDDLEGAGEHGVDLRFQFAAIPVEIQSDHWVRARGPEGRGLLMRVFSPARLEAKILRGSLHPVEGWISPDFGRRVPAPLVSFATLASLPLRIVTILVPVDEDRSPSPAAYPVIVEGPSVAGLVLWNARDVIGIEEDALTLKRG